ncbi:MAG: TolC family protein [Polaromonas sp.]|nr:TolC family protein [Polaromonas sp.]
MNKFFASWLGRCLAIYMFNALGANVSAQGLDFETALRTAQERAPSLQSRIATLKGATALQTSAAQLPDPKLSIVIDSLPVNGQNRGSLTRDDFTQRQLGWEQDVPNRAKRTARAEFAVARTERERALLQAEQVAVRREAGLAWLARYYADRRLILFGELNSHQQLLHETAPAQLAAGRINASEVAVIGLEALALEDRRDELQREADQAAVVLRRWTGSGNVAPLAGEIPVLKVDASRLLANVASNPEIAALTPMRAMAQAETLEAQAAKVGDWSWGIRYGKRGPAFSDFVSVQFSFELPLFSEQRQQPQILAKQKEVQRIEAERDELVRRQTQELETLLAENSELERKLGRLIQQTKPLAEQRTAFALAAYQSGRDKLASVLEARKQQTDVGLRSLELQARQAAVQWRLNTFILKITP